MTLATLWRVLVSGVESEQFMSDAWLADKARLNGYDDFTRRQGCSMVVTSALDMKRRALWAKALETHPAEIRPFPRRVGTR
jgi:hypothetical protein